MIFVNQGYGNGAMLVVKTSTSTTLCSTQISPNHAVDTANQFAGTGVLSFDLQVPLLVGESIRFIVFSDGQGQDGTFDGSAFRASITEVGQVPEPATILPFGLGLFGLLMTFYRGNARTTASNWTLMRL
jgi:hypothetical protein